MRKLLLLFSAVIIFSCMCFAQETTSPPDQPAVAQSAADKEIKSDAELPQTVPQLPLYGILAVGFLCAGYMTLRTN